MLLSVLICFYGKKISVSEFLRSARSSFLLFPIKKENRQRLYNLLSIFILKLIIDFVISAGNQPRRYAVLTNRRSSFNIHYIFIRSLAIPAMKISTASPKKQTSISLYTLFDFFSNAFLSSLEYNSLYSLPIGCFFLFIS